MRWLLVLAMLPLPVAGQYTLYTCMVNSKGYVVGAKLPPSGIFLKSAGGAWHHAGFNLPFLSALDYDPHDPSTVYVAAGNGLLRLTGHGERWKILTGSDVTELLDVAVDRNAPGTIYFSHTAGIQVTHDAGATWRDAGVGPAPQVHRRPSRGSAAERSPGGGQRRGHLSQRGRRPVLAAGRRRGLSGSAHRAIAARSVLLARRHRGRRAVRVRRLRRHL